MKLLSRNCLFRNKRFFLLGTLCFLISSAESQKIGNYVNNGSFENYYISGVIYKIPYCWNAIDSLKYCGELLVPPNKVPASSYAYQWPKHGQNHFITTLYSIYSYNNRGYPRNRLKHHLVAGEVYCVSASVNLSEQSTHGIGSIGIYFGDSILDTISKCTNPIIYLTPQIQNPVNSSITDTLNWVTITGTFVANGTEKYLLMGNFRSNVNSNSIPTNSTNLPANFAEYLIDAVSCIPVDLKAYAGPDQIISPGDSVYIGRENDFAIDSGCTWFQLPNITTAIDTISGMWVKPAITTTYVVRQILECSSEKWDTVVVYMNVVGLETIQAITQNLQVYPVPAQNEVKISCITSDSESKIKKMMIYNNTGQILRKEDVEFKDNELSINIDDLPSGIYTFSLLHEEGFVITKKLVVAK